MQVIGHDEIVNLNIDTALMWEWVDDALRHKIEYLMPPKISINAGKDRFYNTMPVLMPNLGVGGVKMVNRYPNREPALSSKILLYNLETGHASALLDGSYITTMRTGAVAAHSADILGVKDYQSIVFVGLGNTARATLMVLANKHPNREFQVRLVKYKNQHDLFAEHFSSYTNLKFIYFDSFVDAIRDTDIIFSAVTVFHEDICKPGDFSKGVTLIPIHTRGFMECDLVFDRIYGDDYRQISHFKYFSEFPNFAEVAEVIRGEKPGRQEKSERILVYNIGIAAHDFYFAKKILDRMAISDNDINISEPIGKFWC